VFSESIGGILFYSATEFHYTDKLTDSEIETLCFDVCFMLSLAEYSCDGQVLHKNNSDQDG
jgi:hypothetical protein